MATSMPGDTPLITRISELLSVELRMPSADIDVDAPLMQYGLDSIAALTVAGRLEDELEIELPSTLLWDCPTIRSLADYLTEMMRTRDIPALVGHE